MYNRINFIITTILNQLSPMNLASVNRNSLVQTILCSKHKYIECRLGIVKNYFFIVWAFYFNTVWIWTVSPISTSKFGIVSEWYFKGVIFKILYSFSKIRENLIRTGLKTVNMYIRLSDTIITLNTITQKTWNYSRVVLYHRLFLIYRMIKINRN